jgi:hypothetical protein
MKFRLTYEGRLLALSSDSVQPVSKSRHTHEIRKSFHPQLKRLWNIHPALRSATVFDAKNLLDDVQEGLLENREKNFERCGYKFVPLVTEDFSLLCDIHVLFLRPDTPGSLIQSGDIDNRIKTLFDALRMPSNKAELGAYDIPDPEERPFFTLLEDDKLISGISVETDVLLDMGDPKDQNNVRLVITVSIRPYKLGFHNIEFG